MHLVVAILWLLMSAYAADALTTCGAKDVKERIETSSIDYLKSQVATTGSVADKFGIARRRMLASNFEVDLSEMYEISATEAARQCHGKLTLTLPDGLSASSDIVYDVIDTEDGKLLVKEEISGLYSALDLAENILVTRLENDVRETEVEEAKAQEKDDYARDVFKKINEIYSKNVPQNLNGLEPGSFEHGRRSPCRFTIARPSAMRSTMISTARKPSTR